MAADSTRKDVAHEILRSLSHPDFRAEFRRIAPEPERPFVVAAPSDEMGYVFDQLRFYRDGVYVATVDDRGDLHVISMEYGSTETQVPEEADCPVHRETSVSMLLTYLRTYPRPVVCHEVGPDVRFELVGDDGPQELVDA